MKRNLTILCMLLSTAAWAQTKSNDVSVTFFTPSTVRILKDAPNYEKRTGDDLSLVINATPMKVKVTKATKGNITTYSSAALTVAVDNTTGKVTFTDSKGNCLMKEGNHQFETIADGPDKGRFHVTQSFSLDKDVPIYGVGLLLNG